MRLERKNEAYKDDMIIADLGLTIDLLDTDSACPHSSLRRPVFPIIHRGAVDH